MSGSSAGRHTLKAKDASQIGIAGSTIKIELIDEAGNLVGELKRVPGVGKEFNYYFTDYNGANGVTHAFVGVLHQQTTPAAHTEVYVTLNT